MHVHQTALTQAHEGALRVCKDRLQPDWVWEGQAEVEERDCNTAIWLRQCSTEAQLPTANGAGSPPLPSTTCRKGLAGMRHTPCPVLEPTALTLHTCNAGLQELQRTAGSCAGQGELAFHLRCLSQIHRHLRRSNWFSITAS